MSTENKPALRSEEYWKWLAEDLERTGDLRTADGVRIKSGNYVAISDEDKQDIAERVIKTILASDIRKAKDLVEELQQFAVIYGQPTRSQLIAKQIKQIVDILNKWLPADGTA